LHPIPSIKIFDCGYFCLDHRIAAAPVDGLKLLINLRDIKILITNLINKILLKKNKLKIFLKLIYFISKKKINKSEIK
jgi:hypothetical protein